MALVRVPFHGDEIECVQREDGVWISLRRACESVGVDFASQTTKLRAKPWATVAMITTVAEDGKNREFFCLHLDSVPMWLATIEPSRVAEGVREKLIAYQREAARVHLHNARQSRDEYLDELEEIRSLLGAGPGVVLDAAARVVRERDEARAAIRDFDMSVKEEP